jgi:vacuolar protein sorting-associated protein 13A/C
MAVGNIKDAPLQMNALAITDMRLTSVDLQTRIMFHYRQDVLRQLYRILGSADFIGNPVGLFTNVSSGVADIFYEPFTGAVMHGNHDIGVGIAKVRFFLESEPYFTRETPSGSCKLCQEDCLRSF